MKHLLPLILALSACATRARPLPDRSGRPCPDYYPTAPTWQEPPTKSDCLRMQQIPSQRLRFDEPIRF